MNVYGIGTIVKIFRGTVFPEKMIPVEFETALDIGFKFRCCGVSANGFQRAQVVARVEVVDPALGRMFTIVPGSIVLLLRG